jgi:multiple sugar transport system ATP-binding protein
VFLFDEPLSNIDPALREGIRGELAALVRSLGATVLYVTHDHVEAMTLADRVAVLRSGKLLQVSPPRELYERPAAEFVGVFVGSSRMNVLPATQRDGALHAGPFVLARPTASLPESVRVGVRPEHVTLGADGVKATVRVVEPHGVETLVTVAAGDLTLRARVAGFASLRVGDTVGVTLDPDGLHVFDPARDGARVEPS